MKKQVGTIVKDYELGDVPVIKVAYAHILTRPLYYPVNSFAANLAILMRRKTITKTEIDQLRAMGFTVEIIAPQIEIPQGFQ